MANIFSVANWFLKYNYQLREVLDEDTDEISNLKLQKLLYYAQGASLALRNEPLFAEEIYAWKHGPVIPEVYNKFNSHGSQGIPYEENLVIELSDDEVSILSMVYHTFASYSAWGLRNLTHQEDPWKDTRQNEIIPKSAIKKYFLENYVPSAS